MDGSSRTDFPTTCKCIHLFWAEVVSPELCADTQVLAERRLVTGLAEKRLLEA